MVRKQFNFYSFLNQKNAAVRIQKWIRNCRFIHRNHFLLEVRAMLKKESSKYIVLNLHTFGQIQQISDQILLSKRLLNIPFQETTFRI